MFYTKKACFWNTVELPYNDTSRDLCYFSVMKGLCGGFTAVLKLQTVKKSCNCRYTRTKYSAGTDKTLRCGRSDDITEAVVAEL